MSQGPGRTGPAGTAGCYVARMRKGPATRSAGADEPLGFVIASVGNAAALAFESALAVEGLHPRHFAVLRGLRDGEEHSQQQLASSLGIPASRLVGLLALLIDRELVERRESPDDARVKLVRLREEGRDELERLIRLAGRLLTIHALEQGTERAVVTTSPSSNGVHP